ncbi:uncharacterized protein LOC131152079 [Malania oleifera]|uniref:uncharacterized protein LOC131152079 n=1 Tax=Malania oleifera TaxID=397392 RepID=UPI0025AEB9BE|nr:uncharacterized protein LOC131152079 [Malania oleifera]
MDILYADHVKRAVDVQLCNKFKTYRAKMREYFQTMGDQVEAHPYDKVICEKNVANRSKLPMTHYGGSRLFINHRKHDLKTGAKELLPNRYQRTHQRRSREWCEGAQGKHTKMVELRDAPVSEGSQQMTDYQITARVLGERATRGGGGGGPG